jgi:predicted AlkP superfamily pyrophosphatase or phosphodiesterase
VSTKEDLPARLHFGNNPTIGMHSDRIPPIVGIVAEGWTLQAGPEVERPQGGSHGFDNQLHSMATTFIGWGPAFAATAGSIVPAFDIVEVYGILGTVLGLTGLAPNNGTAATVQRVLGCSECLG